MPRQLDVTIHADMKGAAPDPELVREAMLRITGGLDTELTNVVVSVRTHDAPVPVIPPPEQSPQDCELPNCYAPMPHTHPTV